MRGFVTWGVTIFVSPPAVICQKITALSKILVCIEGFRRQTPANRQVEVAAHTLQEAEGSMKTRSQNRGFTTIELMITVAILGILAAVAVVSYSGYIRRARNSEATAVLANIRIKQEAYRSVFHIYADLNGDWVPTEAPGGTKEGRTISDTNWRQLGAVPDGEIYFSYMGEAGAPGADPAHSFLAGLDVNTTTDFWYGAMAVQDLDEDNKCEGYAVFAGSSTMYEVPEAAGNCPD